jgi:hypothetical protein
MAINNFQKLTNSKRSSTIHVNSYESATVAQNIQRTIYLNQAVLLTCPYRQDSALGDHSSCEFYREPNNKERSSKRCTEYRSRTCLYRQRHTNNSRGRNKTRNRCNLDIKGRTPKTFFIPAPSSPLQSAQLLQQLRNHKQQDPHPLDQKQSSGPKSSKSPSVFCFAIKQVPQSRKNNE